MASIVSVPINNIGEPAASPQLHDCVEEEGFGAGNDIGSHFSPIGNGGETNSTLKSCDDAYVEDSVSVSMKRNGVKNASCSLPTGEIGLSLKDPVSFTDKTVLDAYTDKTVLEIEPSEASDNLKSSVIKDICIDEGAPPVDKMWVDNEGVEYERVVFLQSKVASHDNLTKELDCHLLASDDFKSFILNEKVISGENNLLMSKGNTEVSLGKEDIAEESVNAVSNERSMTEETGPVNELGIQSLQGDPSCFDKSPDQPHDQEHVTNAAADVRPYMATDEQTSTSPVASQSISNDDSKAESRPVLLNSDLLPMESSPGKEEATPNAGHQWSGQSSTASVLDDGARDSLTGSKRSFFSQHGLGESSFSGLDSKFDPIVLSGAAPYSGSISFRSDSSTTSQRSFAFPV
ncbi:hypothetical protein ACLOJK_031053 [Asimina triloba]